MDYNFEKKRRIIRNGESKLLKEWQQYSTITADQMLEMIDWIEKDPERNFAALTSTGWKPLTKREERTLTVFRDLDGNAWDGEHFEMPVPEKRQSMFGQTMVCTQKIAIGAWNRV